MVDEACGGLSRAAEGFDLNNDVVLKGKSAGVTVQLHKNAPSPPLAFTAKTKKTQNTIFSTRIYTGKKITWVVFTVVMGKLTSRCCAETPLGAEFLGEGGVLEPKNPKVFVKFHFFPLRNPGLRGGGVSPPPPPALPHPRRR